MTPGSDPIDKSPARVREMFGELAPQYDRMNHLLSMNTDRWWRRCTVRLLKPAAGESILDICTGTGDLAIAFHRYLKGNCQVVGSDFCPQMLDIARGKASESESIRFVAGDALDLPFSDDAFDIVTVAFGLRNVADTDRGLREMVRVCRTNGRIGILEFTTPRSWPMRPLYGWYFRNVLPKIGARLARNRHNAWNYLPESVGEFPQYEALAAKMSAAGMKRIRIVPLTFGIATLYIGEK